MVTDVQTKKLHRIGAIILSILCAALAMINTISFNVSAAEEGSLTLICRSEEVTLTGMQWKIYYAGFRDGNDFVLGGDFADYPVKLDDLSAEAITEAAETLENYAVIDKINPIAEGETDAEGKIKFENLQSGIYLVSGKELKVGNTIYIPSAILIEVRDGNVDLDAYPKFYLDVFGSEYEHYTVKKIWENDENALADRIASITVEIYCDETLNETVTLNTENNWTYDWTAEKGHRWRVKETNIPDKYTVSYRSNETQFAIINSHQTETTVTTTPTTTTVTTTTAKYEPKLPQTGQLWWPVPILALGGMIFVGIGCRLLSRNKKEDD